jgi:hypothetical protein
MFATSNVALTGLNLANVYSPNLLNLSDAPLARGVNYLGARSRATTVLMYLRQTIMFGFRDTVVFQLWPMPSVGLESGFLHRIERTLLCPSSCDWTAKSKYW